MMSRLPALFGVLVVLALSVGLAALNGGQIVTLRLGFATLYGVPLTLVVFGSVVVGMLVMLIAGIHTDLRVRRILRERLAREDEEERARIFVDRNQQDLFDGVEAGKDRRPSTMSEENHRPLVAEDSEGELPEAPVPPPEAPSGEVGESVEAVEDARVTESAEAAPHPGDRKEPPPDT